MVLTFNQKVAFAVAVFSFFAAGSGAADLATLFGKTAATSITAASSLLAGIGGIFLAVVTGQGNLIKDVQAMPGIEKITVNAQANPTLAAAAVSLAPENNKIEAARGAESAVINIAQQG